MKKKSLSQRLLIDFKRHKYKYLIILPILLHMLIFAYKPMYGILIAFQDYSPIKGMSRSPWVGFDNFIRFFKDVYFLRVFKNTLTISFLSLLFSFPVPILFALLLNEIKNMKFKRIVQTVTYMPHFIASVVVCSLIINFTMSDGFITDIVVALGGTRRNLLTDKNLFRPIFIISGIWQQMGWNSIIFLAALSGIAQELYEAAKIDGAGRIKQMIHITLPGILPTIVILLIMRAGSLLSVGSEKILLLYQPLTYEVADVISTYEYRIGIQNVEYSFSTAIGLFNSVVNIILLTTVNKFSKKVAQIGLF